MKNLSPSPDPIDSKTYSNHCKNLEKNKRFIHKEKEIIKMKEIK